MEAETRSDTKTWNGTDGIDGSGQNERDSKAESQKVTEASALRVAIAATFTAEVLSNPVRFWMTRLGIATEVVATPYAQVMQELLSPQSAFATNQNGFNVLLLRPEDWIRDRRSGQVAQNIDHARRTASEIVAGVESLRRRAAASMLIFLCPVSASVPAEYREPFEEILSVLFTRLTAIEHVHCWRHADLIRLYPVVNYEDSRTDRLGHIPYTNSYFAALATLFARRIAVLTKSRVKVIVVDCDNTLWKGTCGEVGPYGVDLTSAYLETQRMLVRQHDAGVLLCVCSKNNEVDVRAVFRERPDMILREEHVISWRVNWEPKSANLKSLADELDLSLDTFVFVDDSEMECADVRAHCPSVLTMRFPESPDEILHFLNHVWAFDRVDVSEESKRRTEQYRRNRARQVALQEAHDLQRFLDSLELRVDVEMMKSTQLTRVAELVQRTTQFNLTGLRRRSNEIERLVSSGELECLVVHVRDRFGDYGLVGALFFKMGREAIDVDTFVLSCRVLGRGVEQRVINELGSIARLRAVDSMVLRYRRTSRNAPAKLFLQSSFAQFESESYNGTVAESVFSVPVAYAVSYRSQPAGLDQEPPGREGGPVDAAASAPSQIWHEEALTLSCVPDIVREMTRAGPARHDCSLDYVEPRTPAEASIAQIWAEVLGLERVSVLADFLEIGGDSLLAVQTIARMDAVLGAELTIHEFFERPTIEGVARRLAVTSHAGSRIERLAGVHRAPSSTAQRRLWFIDRLEGDSTAYHIPLTVRLCGSLDRAALQAALDGLVARHEILRTVFIELDGECMQEIASVAAFSLEHVDLRECPADERDAEVLRWLRTDMLAPFHLSKGPLIRGRLLQLSGDEHVLLLTMHHIVSDAWSLGVMVRETVALYAACRDGAADPLPELSVQYADYARWQRGWLSETGAHEQLRYWEEHLRGAPELLELPTDRTRPATQSYRGEAVRVQLEPELVADIKLISRQLNVTLAMTLFAAWALVLSRMSGQKDVVVGMPAANRRNVELEGLIGLFANTLALRVRLDDDPSAAELLQRVKAIMLGALAHQDTPFEQVVEVLQPKRSLSHSPLFQVMFIFYMASREEIRIPGLRILEQDSPLYTAQFDLSLFLHEIEGGVAGYITYAAALFDAETVDRWIGCFKSVLSAFARQLDVSVSRLPLLAPDRRRQIVELFNATRASYPHERMVHELFEEQVERTAHSVAVVSDGTSLTYAELNAGANRLARFLREKGVGPDQRVAVCLERGLEMVVALLGTLKAGGAYVPLDPSYPTGRLEYMMKSARPRVLLTQEQLRDRLLPITEAEVVSVDTGWNAISKREDGNLDPHLLEVTSRNPAYVIYTSGSTGNPKGVMIEHRGVVNFLKSMQVSPGMTASDCLLAVTTISFDIAALEIFLPLITGAKVVVADRSATSDPGQLIALLEQHDVSVMQATPATWKLLLGGAWSGRSGMKALCGGEALTSGLAADLLRKTGSVWNLYGPTETTIWSCSRQILKPALRGSVEPIGGPIANTRIYILDSHLQIVPIGVVGEIYIGGSGLARGYRGRPDLTAERFLRDELSEEPDARMYKTGDLGRWRADGTIEYLGRNDHQVKVRGFRIELGEIEAQLARHELVKEAVAIVREDVPGEMRIVAYVVPVASSVESALSAEALRMHLKAALPEYMVPGAFVTLERMPLTPNGKIDRRALPAPASRAYATQQYESPQGHNEEVLAEIWQALLRIDRVGRRDNFFELGGHSLLIMRMMERLRRAGLSAEVRDVFESPVLAELATKLTQSDAIPFEVPPNLIAPESKTITPAMLPLVQLEAEHIDRVVQSVPGGVANIQDIYPLAPLQEGILFHHLVNAARADAYVLKIVLAISSQERVEELIAALQAVIDRHDILRTAILWEELPRPVQVVYRNAVLPVEEITLDPRDEVLEQISKWTGTEHAQLDVRYAPLLRLTVARNVAGTQWYAVLQLHHITTDQVSFEAVSAEIAAHLTGREHTLSEPTPYRNHVAQALAYARIHDAETFFRAKLGDIDEPTAPFGLLDVHGDSRLIAETREELEIEVARRIRSQAQRRGLSAATLFHAAWGLVVSHTSGRDDVVFGTVLLGRMHGTSGAHGAFGVFINTLPLRLRLAGVTAGELVQLVQDELVGLLSHEQASLAMAQRCSCVTGAAPLFTTLLNYRHDVPDIDAHWKEAIGIRTLAVRAHSNYPITASVDDVGERFALTVQADQRLDPNRIAGYFRTAVESLVAALEVAPGTPALKLSILPESERRAVVELFNATDASYPNETPIQELFEEQVRRAPDSVAITYEERSVTYSELNGQANQLARYLRAQGATAGEQIPVAMQRSPLMLAAQLAVLKVGGAYVPIEPGLPAERFSLLLQDCGARRVLSDREELVTQAAELIQWTNCAAKDAFGEHAADDLKLPVDVKSAAYVMYTSGSTGVPKGVIVPHYAVNRLVINNGYAQIRDTDRIAHHSNPAFDASTFEIWGALLNGAGVVIIPQPVLLDAAQFAQALKKQSVTVLWISVGLFNQYFEDLADVFPDLRYVLTGGDSLDPKIVKKVLERSPPQRLLNAYGPTECTTFSTTHRVEVVADTAASIPIGRPIRNARIYILDGLRQPVPIGVMGEIYIGGAGVACGYLNRSELTAERFLPDPFSEDRSSRLYKTGDLGRWREDGVIEFMGRNDYQIKVRGFRVELGEIETRLARHPQVKDVVVVARKDGAGEKRLVAYVVVENATDAGRLRAFLKETLPDYMIPGAFVTLDRMPLTGNGKVDRRALPEPELSANAAQEYDPPQGETEEVLAGIWRDLLQNGRIGRGENFFELGGHSLLAIKVTSRVNHVLGTALRVTDLYKNPTIQDLARRVRNGTSNEELIDLAEEAKLDEEIRAIPGTPGAPAKVVLLTGATGFVGRFLLAELLDRTDAVIYCLVRASSEQQAFSRLKVSLLKWDLWREELAHRIVAIPGDLRQPHLGIADAAIYANICASVECIYHCATSMNHLETYAMAKAANVEAISEVLKIATRLKPKVVNYISTLSVFSQPPAGTSRVVDELTPIDQERHFASNGYATSKWVGEKIVMLAANRGIPCNIFRLGLVGADTQRGRYDELQRGYRIFKSCLLSGLGIENYRYESPLTPVDYVARAVVHLASKHSNGRGVFHISSSSQMDDGVFERCNLIAGTSLDLLSSYEWICEIKRLHYQGYSLPAVPLIEHAFSMDEESFEYERTSRSGQLHFGCTRTQQELEAAGIVAPELNDELLRRALDWMISRDPDCSELIETDGIQLHLRSNELAAAQSAREPDEMRHRS